MAERIDKILAHEGYGSRKDIKKLLRISEVCINGVRVTDPGKQVDPQNDIITIDDEEVDLHQNLYIMMNKIMHTVSSNKDGEHQTVFDLLDDKMHTPYLSEKLHLVGRLDMDTEGLLLFTTDGELTHRVTSPKTHIDKTYFCLLEHEETAQHKKDIEKAFLEGIEVGPEDNEPGFRCEPATITWTTKEQYDFYTKNSSVAEKIEKELGEAVPELFEQSALLTITEGKYHQVKRMFQAVGNKIVFLKRISMGELKLDPELKPGEYKLLSPEEISLLS
ncbi:MAG: rRNA pseudouridine synthase [Treponema sp.]|nr:rRNA pseudouridine synthase [Treponema sp.]